MLGSAWTKKYPYVHVMYYEECTSDFQEDMVTKEYMKKWEIKNVRGGSYYNIKLSSQDLYSIEKEINHSSNCCHLCKKPGHFVNNCPEKLDKNCSRCGRNTHTIKTCYATYHSEGYRI